MESLEKELAEVFAEQQPRREPARLLIVAEQGAARSNAASCLTRRGHRCTCVSTLTDARAATSQARFDLVLMDPDVSDACELTLAQMLRSISSARRTILFSEHRSFDRAVEALRGHIIDFVSLPHDMDALGDRVQSALNRIRDDVEHEERLARLRTICEKLVAARNEVSAQVEQLCQDLVDAYQDVSTQMNEVAMGSEYRTLLNQELDVEELLRTSLEYMLTKTAPTNAAVFLPDSSGAFDLGAYVNYDCPRESITSLLEHLCQYICPQMTSESEIVSFEDAEEFSDWIGIDAGFFAGCQVVAYSCLHEGECLAVVVLFRNKTDPFDDRLGATIDVLRPIFAEQLAQIIKVHHRALPQWPDDASGGNDEYDDNDSFDPFDNYDDYGFGGMAA